MCPKRMLGHGALFGEVLFFFMYAERYVKSPGIFQQTEILVLWMNLKNPHINFLTSMQLTSKYPHLFQHQSMGNVVSQHEAG